MLGSPTMRRRRALLALGVLVGAGAACTTFAFPRPSDVADAGDTGADVVADGTTTDDGGADGDDGGEAAAPTTLLPMDLALHFCTELFVCARLPEAVELSLAWPFNTPSTPLNFSAGLRILKSR